MGVCPATRFPFPSPTCKEGVRRRFSAVVLQFGDQAEWNGAAPVGLAGDGTTWGDKNNWSNEGTPDVLPSRDAMVVFDPASTPSVIRLQEARTVQSTRFRINVTLAGQSLTVGSGVVDIEQEVMVRAEAQLIAPHGLIKRGEGTLAVSSVDAAGGSMVEAGVLQMVDGSLRGGGGLTVVEDGEFQVDGTADIDGLLAINAGGLVTVAPGGTLRASEFRQDPDATLALQFAASTAERNLSPIRIDTPVSLRGVLRIEWADDFLPQLGTELTVFEAEELNGTFRELQAPQLDDRFRLTLRYEETSVLLELQRRDDNPPLIPEPATWMLATIGALLMLPRRRSVVCPF